MVKAKTYSKQRKLKTGNFPKAIPFSPTEELADSKFIAEVIMECLQNNDPEGVMEAIENHIEALNKMKLIKKGDIPKTTFYHSLRSKNPTIKTLAKMIHAYSS